MVVSCTGESSAFNKTHPPHQPSGIYSYLNTRIKRKKKAFEKLNFISGTFYCKTVKMFSSLYPPRRGSEGPVSLCKMLSGPFPTSVAKAKNNLEVKPIHQTPVNTGEK